MTTDHISHWTRPWHPDVRRLHWYVLPPEELAEVFVNAQAAVARAELSAIPTPWLHCTITSMRATDKLDDAQRADVLRAGQAALRGLTSFDTDPARPENWGEAVVYNLSPSPGLHQLHEALLPSSMVLGATPRPFTPHITLCYAHAPGPGAPTERALQVPSPLLPPFRVTEIHLLDVRPEPGPERGWYSWERVGSIHLPDGPALSKLSLPAK